MNAKDVPYCITVKVNALCDSLVRGYEMYGSELIDQRTPWIFLSLYTASTIHFTFSPPDY